MIARRTCNAVTYDLVTVYPPAVISVVVVYICRVHIVYGDVVGVGIVTELVKRVTGCIAIVTIETIQITCSLAIGTCVSIHFYVGWIIHIIVIADRGSRTSIHVIYYVIGHICQYRIVNVIHISRTS